MIRQDHGFGSPHEPFARATLRDKKKKERRGLRKRGGENSPISPPLDPRLILSFFFTNHGKEKAKQFMMMLGDHEAAHFVRQGVAVMQFFTKNNANLVKITVTWK